MNIVGLICKNIMYRILKMLMYRRHILLF